MPFGIIYAIRNTVNGKQYVGQTVHPIEVRWLHHLKSARQNVSTPIYKALRKYGSDLFSVVQIDEAHSRAELDAQEVWHILFLNTLAPNGYNLTSGGGGRSNFRHSLETKLRISKLRKGFKHTEQAKAKMANAWKTRLPASTETRSRMSAARKGYEHSDETRMKIGESNSGKCFTPERKLAISKALTKTHCKQGHPLAEGNIYHPPSGRRSCLTCHNAWKQQYYHGGANVPNLLSPNT